MSSTASAGTPCWSPSTMASSTSRTGERRPRADVAARRQAQPVDEAGEPAAAPVEAQRGERRGEHDVLAAPLEVAPVVEGARLGHRQRFDLDRGSASRVPSTSGPSEVKPAPIGGAEIERERRPLGHAPAVDGRHLDVEADAVAARLGQRQGGRPQGDGLARRSAPGGSAPAPSSRAPPTQSPADHDERRQSDEAAPASAAAGSVGAADRAHRGAGAGQRGDARRRPRRKRPRSEASAPRRGRTPDGERRQRPHDVGREQQMDGGRRPHAAAL